MTVHATRRLGVFSMSGVETLTPAGKVNVSGVRFTEVRFETKAGVFVRLMGCGELVSHPLRDEEFTDVGVLVTCQRCREKMVELALTRLKWRDP